LFGYDLDKNNLGVDIPSWHCVSLDYVQWDFQEPNLDVPGSVWVRPSTPANDGNDDGRDSSLEDEDEDSDASGSGDYYGDDGDDGDIPMDDVSEHGGGVMAQ
jgi:hypothetical protein